MTFPETTPARRSPSVLDLMVAVAIAAFPLAAFAPAAAPGPGRLNPEAAARLSVVLILLGHLLWWLPRHAARTSRRWAEAAVLLALPALAFVYITTAFLVFIFDARAAALVIASQTASLLYVSFRP